jgi:hypothetical protein
MILSSITASTISLGVSENLILAAGLGIPTVLGNQGITLNANSNINIVANNDVSLTSYHSMFLTATSSIVLSNAVGTAGFGFDETSAAVLFGSNVVFQSLQDTYINTTSNLYLNTSNDITIQCFSTINTTSYNYYQASSNLTDLHNVNYSNTSSSNAYHITPDFIVSTNMNSYSIRSVRQPFIQYGETTGSNNTGNRQVILPVPYSSINAYKAFITMEDSDPAEMSCVRNSSSTFTIYWQTAGGGTHTIAWNTMGNLGFTAAEPPPPPPSNSPAYNLNNNIYGDTGYFTWFQDGAPDYETVYTLQSPDDGEYSVYTTNTVFTTELTLYSLAPGYYYKFYISSHYGASPRVESSNSEPQYVFYM